MGFSLKSVKQLAVVAHIWQQRERQAFPHALFEPRPRQGDAWALRDTGSCGL
jgi:hypothetical protein